MVQASIVSSSNSESLHHCDEIRFNDALIGRDQPQAMNARGGYDDTVSGISQQITKRGNFPRDIRREWQNPKHGVCVQVVK